MAGVLVVGEMPVRPPADEAWTSQEYNSFTNCPEVAMHVTRGGRSTAAVGWL